MHPAASQHGHAKLSVHNGSVREFLGTTIPAGTVGVAWLGQAGFVLRCDGRVILIDPYLSDHLAQKYRDHRFSHERLMPAPIQVIDLVQLDGVLCTHRHSDHLDAPTLREIAERFAQAVFVIPQAERATALAAGLPDRRVICASHLRQIALHRHCTITSIPAAHEDLKLSEQGEHHFLGYVLRLGSYVLYHSGDCVPYPGLVEALKPLQIDVALLPVNGRDESRRAGGAPGNFHLHEAIELCRDADIPALIPHHFGMFAFNTIALEVLREQAGKVVQPHLTVPSMDHYFLLEDRA